MITKQAQPAEHSTIDQIAYCCLASPDVNALKLVGDLRIHPDVITGLLICEGRLLIHWLEGPAQQIEALWAEVQSDVQQHCVVRLLHRQGVTERWFKDWQMRPTSRLEMMNVVREVKEQTGKHSDEHALQWQHAISTLSILLNPELTQFYAMRDEAVAAC